MRNLDHPNIVKLYGVAAGQEPLMLVMELVRKGYGRDSVGVQNSNCARYGINVELYRPLMEHLIRISGRTNFYHRENEWR